MKEKMSKSFISASTKRTRAFNIHIFGYYWI